MNPNKNKRVLVIDDNPAIHADLRKVFAPRAPAMPELEAVEAALFGVPAAAPVSDVYQLDSAHQGQEGLAMVQRAIEAGEPYAVAFVDMRMPPGWDGVETIEHLWQADPALQVIICTAYSDFSWGAIVKRLGRSDKLVILKKPFDNLEVFQLVSALTQKWELTHQLNNHLADLDKLVAQRTREIQETHDQLQREAAERRQALRALRQSEARFAKAFCRSPLPMAVWRLDRDELVDANDRFQEVLGYTLPDLVHRPMREVDFWEDPALRETIRAVLAERRSARQMPGQLRTRTGDCRDVVLTVEYFEMAGAPHGLLIAQDFTDQLRLEKELRQAQKMEAVGRLAGGVAHDFNNILTIVEGHVHMLREPPGPDWRPEESLRQIVDVTERASRLTHHLLAFSRRQTMQPKVLNLNSVLTRLRFMLGRLIGEHIHWICQLADELPCVEADENGIEQIITHLVVNASDAMPEGGQLTIRTHAMQIDAAAAAGNPEASPGRFVCLAISDTGVGMDSQTLVHLFEPFFTTKGVGQGSGLGLSTVYGIVKQHQGWVEVESQEHRGSTFKVYLPVTEKVGQDCEPRPVPLVVGKGKETILLVEDEPLLREVVSSVLTPLGYCVLEAEDAPSALQIWSAHQGKVDLLLTDLKLPNGMTGLELAQQLKREHPPLKVVLSSGYHEAELIHTWACRNEVHFLPKPYLPDMLTQTVRACLDGELRRHVAA